MGGHAKILPRIITRAAGVIRLFGSVWEPHPLLRLLSPSQKIKSWQGDETFARPITYSLAMAAEAMAALLLGRLFDRIGIGAMILATCASALSAPLAFLGGPTAAMTGMVLWGIGTGAQASVMRAAIAPLAPASQRGTAYGIFNSAYGLAWLAGSSLLGVLYDWSVPALAAVSVLLQGAALAILWRVPDRCRVGNCN